MEGVDCLKPREQQTVMFKGGPVNIDPISNGLAKVVILLVILFGSCARLPANQTFGWPQSISYNQTFSIDLSIT